jgi:hypothetical protein
MRGQRFDALCDELEALRRKYDAAITAECRAAHEFVVASELRKSLLAEYGNLVERVHELMPRFAEAPADHPRLVALARTLNGG